MLDIELLAQKTNLSEIRVMNRDTWSCQVAPYHSLGSILAFHSYSASMLLYSLHKKGVYAAI